LENSLAEKIPESGDQLWYIQEKTSDAKLSWKQKGYQILSLM
jgi:hypothetical protein